MPIDHHQDAISTLDNMFGHMAVSPTLNRIPNEILVNIFEHLVPEAVALSTETSLWNTESTEWTLYLDRRRDLLSLRLVSKRVKTLTEPLFFRHIFVGGPRSLCILLCQLIKKPSLGPLIRHMSSSIELSISGMAGGCWIAWRYLLNRNQMRHMLTGPAFSRDHPLRKLLKWLQHDAGGPNEPQFPSILLCAILCFANKLEILNLRMPEQTPFRPQVTLWNWFLNQSNNPGPWLPASYSIPHDIITAYPSWEGLNYNPCWPPPFLEKVVIEYGREWGGNLVTCNIIRHADMALSLEATNRLNKSGVHLPLTDLVNAMASLSPEDHVTANTYLDTLSRLRPIQAADLTPSLTTLKTTTLPDYTTPPTSSQTPHPDLTTLLTTLHSPTWQPHLNMHTKTLTLHLADFLSATPHPEETMDLSNLTHLTFHTSLNPSTAWHSSNNSAAESDLLESDSPRWSRALRNRTTTTLAARLRRLAQRAPRVRVLDLGGLVMAREVSRQVYLQEFAVSHQVRWAVCLRGFGESGGLRELVGTMEGLFGAWGRWEEMCDAFALERDWGGDGDGDGDGGYWDDGVGEVERKRLLQELRDRVDDLPAGLEKLTLVEWFGEYADGGWMGYFELGVSDLEERVYVMGRALGNLLRVFEERRPALKEVVLRTQKWGFKDADELWESWVRGELFDQGGLMDLLYRYRDSNLVFRVEGFDFDWSDLSDERE